MLRSLKTMEGYSIGATDGDIGHVQGISIDKRTCAIHYGHSRYWPAQIFALGHV